MLGALGGAIAGGIGAAGTGAAAGAGGGIGLGGLGTLLGGIGGLAGGIGGLFSGGDEGGPEDLDIEMQRAINWEAQELARTLGPLQQQYYSNLFPQLNKLTSTLGPILQQQLQQPGLPPELEQQVWNLAKQRLARGAGDIESKLGHVLTSKNMLRSGEAPQAWLDKVGLPYLQELGTLGTQRGLANYDAFQRAIGNVQSFLGRTPTYSPSFSQIQQPTADDTDYAGLGSLFAKGLGQLGSIGRKPTAGSLV